jgi:hypothetical protein
MKRGKRDGNMQRREMEDGKIRMKGEGRMEDEEKRR